MSDPLKDYQFQESEGNSLFLTVKKGDSIKLRVLTVDPMISKDKYGNTRFAFVVWNYNEQKAQILNKGASIARPIQQLHTDEDYGANIQKLDVKLVATSTGHEDKDVEYTLNPLPQSTDLTSEQVEEAKKINLENVIKNGIRMSAAAKGETTPEVTTSPQVDDEVHEVEDTAPINLDSIPF